METKNPQKIQLIHNKKGMSPVSWITTFLTVGIFASIAAVVIAAVRDTQASNSTAYVAANNSITAVGNLTTQLGTAGTIAGISVIVLAAVVILGYFGFRGQMQN